MRRRSRGTVLQSEASVHPVEARASHHRCDPALRRHSVERRGRCWRCRRRTVEHHHQRADGGEREDYEARPGREELQRVVRGGRWVGHERGSLPFAGDATPAVRAGSTRTRRRGRCAGSLVTSPGRAGGGVGAASVSSTAPRAEHRARRDALPCPPFLAPRSGLAPDSQVVRTLLTARLVIKEAPPAIAAAAETEHDADLAARQAPRPVAKARCANFRAMAVRARECAHRVGRCFGWIQVRVRGAPDC